MAATLVHLWTDEAFPSSVVANGGVFIWKDGRENPDTCVAAVTYPKGFLYTYKTTFGNSYRSFSRIQGRNGTIENYGGEGASLFVTTEEGGRKEFDPWESGPVYSEVPIVGPPSDAAATLKVPERRRPILLGRTMTMWSIWSIGSRLCGRAGNRMPLSITAFPTPLSVSWRRRPIGRERNSIGIRDAKKLLISRYDSFSTLQSDKTAVAATLLNSTEESVIGYCISQVRMSYVIILSALLLLTGGALLSSAAQSSGHEHTLKVSVNSADGKYTIAMPGSAASPALRAGIGAQVDGHWLHASDYPQPAIAHSQVQGFLGGSYDWQVTYSGLQRAARSDLSPACLFE